MSGTPMSCLLYTSDAADERSSVDLGGRRIIKKKKKCNRAGRYTYKDKNWRNTEEMNEVAKRIEEENDSERKE